MLKRFSLSILVLLTIASSAFAQFQPLLPNSLPYPNSNGYYKGGYLQADSGFLYTFRDTMWKAKPNAAHVIWRQANDTSMWMWNSRRWVQMMSSSNYASIINNSGLSTGILNDNTGAGYRWVKPVGQQVKTAFAGLGVSIDSTSNTNGLTFAVDTSQLNDFYLNTGNSQTSISILNDSTLIICNDLGVCDTISIVSSVSNISSVSFLNDSTIVVCALVDTIPVCDTIDIPAQNIYIFQNGLEKLAGTNIVEFGGTLLHNTTLQTNYFKQYFNGITVYDFPYNFYQGQSFQNSASIVSFNHSGDPIGGYPNKVKLGINYTGAEYLPDSIAGYFGDSTVGYEISTNNTPHGSYGRYFDDSTSKTVGIFFHTQDTTTSDGITMWAIPAHMSSSSSLSALPENYKVLTALTNKDLKLWNYPSSRNDGNTPKALYTDAQGNVKLGKILATASNVQILNDSTLMICSGNGNNVSCDTLVVEGSDPIQTVFVINDTTLLVCNIDLSVCDTFIVEDVNFDRGFFDPNQASFAPTLHNAYDQPFTLANVDSFTVFSKIGADYSQIVIKDDYTKIKSITQGYESMVRTDGVGKGASLDLGSYLTADGTGAYIGLSVGGGVKIGTTTDYANSVDASSVYVDVSSSALRLVNLTTDNTAPQVLGKDALGNSVWRDASSISAGITANNGLTMSTSSNVQLGGTLLFTTTIAAGTSYALNVTGAGQVYTFRATNTTGTAVKGEVTAGSAIYGYASGNGYGGYFEASGASGVGVFAAANNGTTAIGVWGSSTQGLGAQFNVGPSSTNTMAEVVRVYRTSSGTATDGIGGYIGYQVETDNSQAVEAGRLGYLWSNATFASRTSRFELYTTNSAVVARKMAVAGNGDVTFDAYPDTRNDGATTIAFYPDANGNLKVGPITGAGGTGVDNNNVGAGYRWLKPITQEIKTAFNGFGILIDSTTNTNGLTFTADTSATGLATQHDISQFITGVSANNGLTEDGVNNIQLGGTLVENTDINVSTYTFTVTGANVWPASTFEGITSSNGYAVKGTATVNGVGVYGISDAGAGVYGKSTSYHGVVGVSTSGTGVSASSTSSVGMAASSTSGMAGTFLINPSSTNTVATILQLQRNTSGSVANGVGMKIEMQNQTTTGMSLANEIISKWTDATNATRTSQFEITTINNGAVSPSTVFTLAGTGALRLNNYGVNTFTGTAAYWLGVDASGNVVELAAPSGGGGTWGSITGTLSNQTDLQSALDAKQPLDADLTTIAGLTATTNNFIISSSSAWSSQTPTQATALLDVFTSSAKGLVPASGGGTTNFLRADGTWAAAGGGSVGTLEQVTTNGSTTSVGLTVIPADPSSGNMTNSPSITLTGKGNDAGSVHTSNWQQFIDVTTVAGVGGYNLQQRVDAGTWANMLRLGDNYSVKIGDGVASANYTIAYHGSTASAIGAIALSQNATAGASNSVVLGGQNTVISSGAIGAVSVGTDGHHYALSAYSFTANDANDVWGESASAFGFGQDVYSRNGFAAGNDNIVGYNSNDGLGTANLYESSIALGTHNYVLGSRSIAIGRALSATVDETIVIGMGVTGSNVNKLVASTSRSFNVGFNSTVPTFQVLEASGAGTYGQTRANGTMYVGSIANDNTETNLVVWNATDRIFEYRTVASLPYLTAEAQGLNDVLTIDNQTSRSIRFNSTATEGIEFYDDLGTTNHLKIIGDESRLKVFDATTGFDYTFNSTSISANRVYEVPNADVTLVGQSASTSANQVGYFTGNGIIAGSNNYTWNGSTLDINGALDASGTFTNGSGFTITQSSPNTNITTNGFNLNWTYGTNGNLTHTFINGGYTLQTSAADKSRQVEIIKNTDAGMASGTLIFGYQLDNDVYSSVGTVDGYYLGTAAYNTLGQISATGSYGMSMVMDIQTSANNPNAWWLHGSDGKLPIIVRKDGNVKLENLKTGSTAPTTNGTTKMVVTDADGQFSFADIPAGGSFAIGDATDVTITSVADNQLLKYNSGTSQWENWTPNYLTSYTETDPNALKIASNLSDLNNAATARTNLGATTVGNNIFTVTNPSAVRWIRINADNTVTLRTAAETVSDIGALTSYTETDPLALKIASNLSDLNNTATARTNLGATTVGGNIFTLTNPSAISFLKVNADNTVTAESAATFKTSLSLNNVDNTSDATKNSATATLTNKTIDADNNTIVDIQRKIGISIVSPTASEQISLYKAGSGGATAVDGFVTLRGTTPSVTYAIHYGTTYGTSQGTIVASNTVNTVGATTITIGTTAIPSNAYIWLATTATSGTVDEFTVHLNYKY